MKTYQYSVVVGTVKAESLKEAKKLAARELVNLAGSNDGSEILANAQPIVTEAPERKR